MILINDICSLVVVMLADPGQLELLKSTNNFVLNNYVKPSPVGGEAVHFYKTTKSTD